MSTKDFVEKKDKEERLSHIKTLFLIAASDGKIHPNEIDLITRVSVRIGLSGEELNFVMNNPQDIA
ncbi:MAG: TerB family tellurite resistance protein, partial [bacterium]